MVPPSVSVAVGPAGTVEYGVIQIYGTKKSKPTQKAERFFKERNVPYQFVDLSAKAPGGREIELFLRVIGEDSLIDTESKSYKKRGMAYMAFDAAEELEADPLLMVMPIVRDGQKAAAGIDEAFWSSLAEQAKP
jgi:arsenate reductase-like glutaredoxin family protein